jgi:hypothetical protein
MRTYLVAKVIQQFEFGLMFSLGITLLLPRHCVAQIGSSCFPARFECPSQHPEFSSGVQTLPFRVG